MKKRALEFGIVNLLIAVSVFCTACGGAKAATMKLVRAEGELVIYNDREKELEPVSDMNLYSGYGIETKPEAYAWINLDSVKLAKMDQNSEIEIEKSGKDLEILLNSGSLYFNVSEPLADDETMSIRTSTMAVGIRGTCGWMESADPSHMQVYILEGKVECTVTDQESGEQKTEAVSEGETAVMSVSGNRTEITVEAFEASDIPDFVMEEEPPVSMPVFIPWSEAGLEDHVMEWGDEGLEQGMRRRTGIEEGDIMLSDVWELTDTANVLRHRDIRDISALGELTNLRYLYLDDNQIRDISALGNLTNLENLILSENQISDISALGNLKNLYQLLLEDNQIEDISSLEGLTKLKRLKLQNNRILDISPLRNMTRLTYLDLGNNRIRDISDLAGLKSLNDLNLENNQISDISSLSNLEKLDTVTLEGNDISDYSPIDHLD